MDIEWCVTFVYAYPKKKLQLQLWLEILLLDPVDKLWMLIWDFNAILYLEEKIGGTQSANNYMINFSNFLRDGNLVSLPAYGVLFTWSNCHKNHTVIFERLDRALANPSWLNLFPDFNLHNFPVWV